MLERRGPDFDSIFTLVVLDIALTLIAHALTLTVRTLSISRVTFGPDTSRYFVVVVMTNVVALALAGGYSVNWNRSAGTAVVLLVRAIVASSVLLSINALLQPDPVPLSVALVGNCLAFSGIVVIRFRARLLEGTAIRRNQFRPRTPRDRTEFTQSEAVPKPGMFINYRRLDTAMATGRVYDTLCQHFARKMIFIDIASIELGEDFVESIEAALQESEIMLVVIGQKWLTLTDSNRKRRIDDPRDMVHMEIRLALENNITIIPVLVDGATMPQSEDLPHQLAELSRKNALDVSSSRFQEDMGKLVRTLKKHFGS